MSSFATAAGADYDYETNHLLDDKRNIIDIALLPKSSEGNHNKIAILFVDSVVG